MTQHKQTVDTRYSDIKDTLKQTFDAFVDDPKAFGVDDNALIHEIQSSNTLSKQYMWKMFKDATKLKMHELAVKDVASAFIIDFEQDEDHQLVTVKQLKQILADPENKDYDLEPEMIAYIKSDTFDKQTFINHVVSLDTDLNQEDDGFGRKMLQSLKTFWKKIAPFVDRIVDVLVDVGSVALKNMLDQKIKNESIQHVIHDTVDDVADSVKQLDNVVTTAVDASDQNKDVKNEVLNDFQEIGTDLAGDLQEHVTTAAVIGQDLVINSLNM